MLLSSLSLLFSILTDFEKNVIPSLRVKGTKLIFQTVPVIGVDGKDGIRILL